jgi:hypothetical protein
VRLLLARGAKKNLHAAIFFAVYGGHSGVVALLCAVPTASAEFAQKTHSHDAGTLTPLALAILLEDADCEAVQRAHGATE